MRCYIASPFFNPEQLEEVEEIKKVLRELKVKFYSPKDEIICPPDADDKTRMEIFHQNIAEINGADFIICNTNNKDMGTIFEAGVAYAVDVPIIYFNQHVKGKFNLMLSSSGMIATTTYEQLKKAIKRFLREGEFREPYEGKIE